MRTESKNPASCGNTRRASSIFGNDPELPTTSPAEARDLAINFVARRYRLPMPLAAVVVGLACLGGPFA